MGTTERVGSVAGSVDAVIREIEEAGWTFTLEREGELTSGGRIAVAVYTATVDASNGARVKHDADTAVEALAGSLRRVREVEALAGALRGVRAAVGG